MDKKKITRIRKIVERSRRGPGRRARYSEFVKKAAKELLGGGMSAAELVNQTGISRATLFAWSKGASGEKKFRSVSVGAPLEGAAELRVVLASGVVIEGVSMAALAAVLRSVS